MSAGEQLSIPMLLTAVVISFSTCCFWLPFIPLFRLPNSIILFSSCYGIIFLLRDVSFLCRIIISMPYSLETRQAKPWKNGSVIFKWGLFSAATFVYTCSFLHWNWAGAQITWGPWGFPSGPYVILILFFRNQKMCPYAQKNQHLPTLKMIQTLHFCLCLLYSH